MILGRRSPARSVRQARGGLNEGRSAQDPPGKTAVTPRTGRTPKGSVPKATLRMRNRHDCATHVRSAQTTRSFSQPACTAKGGKRAAARAVLPSTPRLSRSGPETAPGHSQEVPRPSRRVLDGTRTGRAICHVPPALPSAFASGCTFVCSEKKGAAEAAPLPQSTMNVRAPSPSSIRTVEPSGTSPPSSFSASGSCRYLCTARLSGRAP